MCMKKKKIFVELDKGRRGNLGGIFALHLQRVACRPLENKNKQSKKEKKTPNKPMVIVYKLLISPSWCTGVTSGMHKDLSLNRRSRSLSINMSLNAEGLSGLSSAQNEFSHSDNPGVI